MHLDDGSLTVVGCVGGGVGEVMFPNDGIHKFHVDVVVAADAAAVVVVGNAMLVVAVGSIDHMQAEDLRMTVAPRNDDFRYLKPNWIHSLGSYYRWLTQSGVFVEECG